MFGTSGIRGEVGEEVTCDLALAVGRALASEGHDRVVVGRDARESGRPLADAAAAGLRECGADVLRVGQAATPTVARSVEWRDADAGLMVTASHNPPEDNGLKLWNPSGQAFDERQREAIERRVREGDFDLAAWDELGECDEWGGAVERHADALADAAEVSEPLSVVVDVGNGVGWVTAEALRRLGCDVQTLNGRADGSFPARPSEPTAENCRGLREFAAATDADLGIAHDGDADRMRAVTADGEFVSGDLLLALFADEATSPRNERAGNARERDGEAGEGQRVAAPVDTSLAVDDLLAACEVEVTRTRVGDVFVAERATEPDVAFGGEPSGAWIWPDETLCPDGPLAACRLAELVAERGPLAALVGEIETYPLRRGSVETEEKRRVMEAVGERVEEQYGRVDDRDGVRVSVEGGWFLIRASGTEPVVRVTAEARTESRADELFAEAKRLVEAA